MEYPAGKDEFWEDVKADVKDYFVRTGLDEKDPIPTLLTALFIFSVWVTGYYLAFTHVRRVRCVE